MDEVSMNDGLDTPETIAFGLGAVETAALALALLGAYLLTRSGLPAALAWGLAGLTALGGAALAWLRLADRSLLDWTVRLGAHCWRRRREALSAVTGAGDHVAARVRARWPRRPRLPGSRRGGARRGLSIAAGRPRPAERGAITVRLLHPGTSAPPHPGRPTPVGVPGTRRAWRLGVFSLRGGVGRTTLACELSAVLAARGRAAARAGRASRRLQVTLLDLDGRLPAAALRLGLPLWAAGDGEVPQRHASGLELRGGTTDGDMEDASLGDLVDSIEATGSDLVVLDLPSHLSPLCRAALTRCDEVAVVITPTPGGVLDGYRSTAALRALGLRGRLLHVLNRAVEGFDATELMSDLGIIELTRIPDDPALRVAEDEHRVDALEGRGAAALALGALAADINTRVNGAAIPEGGAERWGGRAG